ncbi:hypothetical protein RB12065 [Rhodopirellula baltica SH 1]|uniref:Uncharacterized protein n=1 Tax=Rhodopirellula baltica (strain DSM 10527 / NCIMB 13988 / SH1) TaxID=243090 RepID=Q7UJ84_RHOBA|nr:hypothetical protein RB12065 [Rhodopirellula baltica SH 1]
MPRVFVLSAVTMPVKRCTSRAEDEQNCIGYVTTSVPRPDHQHCHPVDRAKIQSPEGAQCFGCIDQMRQNGQEAARSSDRIKMTLGSLRTRVLRPRNENRSRKQPCFRDQVPLPHDPLNFESRYEDGFVFIASISKECVPNGWMNHHARIRSPSVPSLCSVHLSTKCFNCER